MAEYNDSTGTWGPSYYVLSSTVINEGVSSDSRRLSAKDLQGTGVTVIIALIILIVASSQAL